MFRVSSVEELQGVMAEFDVASPGTGSEAGPGDDFPMPVSRCSS
jgi:hypothetical protein